MWPADVAWAVDVEEPAGGRECIRMGDLARLYQELNWKQRDRLAQGGGGALKGRITASPSGGELLVSNVSG